MSRAISSTTLPRKRARTRKNEKDRLFSRDPSHFLLTELRHNRVQLRRSAGHPRHWPVLGRSSDDSATKDCPVEGCTSSGSIRKTAIQFKQADWRPVSYSGTGMLRFYTLHRSVLSLFDRLHCALGCLLGRSYPLAAYQVACGQRSRGNRQPERRTARCAPRAHQFSP